MNQSIHSFLHPWRQVQPSTINLLAIERAGDSEANVNLCSTFWFWIHLRVQGRERKRERGTEDRSTQLTICSGEESPGRQGKPLLCLHSMHAAIHPHPLPDLYFRPIACMDFKNCVGVAVLMNSVGWTLTSKSPTILFVCLFVRE